MARVLYNPAVERFSFGDGHPFRLDRGRLFINSAIAHGILPEGAVIPGSPAGHDALLAFHDAGYADALRSANDGELQARFINYGLGLQDNPVFAGLHDLCLVFAGSALQAADAALSGEKVFLPVGGFHHAMRGRAGGFCYINDIGLAVERLKSAGKKVLYLDIDAHHGDGVQDAFYADPGVLKVSFHETGRTLFPFTGFEDETGAGPGDGYNVNVPLHNNADDEVFLWLFRRLFPPLYDWFKPDVTLAQIGVDMMSTDPLTHLRLTNNAYVEAVQMINAHSGAAVFFGGGGYSPENIVRGYTLAWAAISGADIGDDYGLAMLGGQFLGSSGMNTLSSLKDMNIYLSGPDKVSAVAEAQRVYKTVKSNVGRKLGLELPD